MAKTTLPDPLARRYLLEGNLDATKARALGDAYLAEGREIEAIEFLARAEATDALQALRAEAIERGDVFLMRSASGALGEEPSPESWRALADAAEAAGRERDHEAAMRMATVEG